MLIEFSGVIILLIFQVELLNQVARLSMPQSVIEQINDSSNMALRSVDTSVKLEMGRQYASNIFLWRQFCQVRPILQDLVSGMSLPSDRQVAVLQGQGFPGAADLQWALTRRYPHGRDYQGEMRPMS